MVEKRLSRWPPNFTPIWCSWMTGKGSLRLVVRLRVTGTLGVLSLAAERGMVNLAEAFDRLRQTNFRYPQAIMDRLLDEASGQG